MMQGAEMNPHLASPVYENVEGMTNDRSSEYAYDPSLYYPAATSYGYYCTGFETPNEWDENHTVFGVDGPETQYAGAQAENMPFVYYTPSYGYADSPFNPYNPYIPGAMIGVDGSYVATQPYYNMSHYQGPASSAGYYPYVQSGSNVIASSSVDYQSDVAPAANHRANASNAKHVYPSNPATFSANPSKGGATQANALTGASQGLKVNAGASKHHNNRMSGSGGSAHGASSHMAQNVNAPISYPSTGNVSYGKVAPQANQFKYSYPVAGGLSEYSSGPNGQVVFNDPWSKFYYTNTAPGVNGFPDQLGEQNRGPRTSKSKNEFVVKAFTTRAGQCNSEGNIVISVEQYNKEDFRVEYPNAKFFVIKSYSEDDVHKSIKYNVWSSTPNGNKRLNSAYEDAQKIAAGKPGGCPIFLFFSVNASGQFCGVAEMIGAVDFDNDMDFWQQDKWSGSFPVKWHIIKDVPNPTFRHIKLENNENKPVTNSRDTQDIMHEPGSEMLKLCKNYSSKTSLLDDFMYYESRQKIMYDQRVRLYRKHLHALEPVVKHNSAFERPHKEDEVGTWVEKVALSSNSSVSKKSDSVPEVSSGADLQKSDVATAKQVSWEKKANGDVSSLNFGTLSIQPKQSESNVTVPAPLSDVTAVSKSVAAPPNVVTVGSVPIKVGANRSSRMLTIGSIQVDPKALQHGNKGGVSKGNPQK